MQEKQQNMREKDMKNTMKNIEPESDELLPEYEIDYSKTVRNPYFTKGKMFVEIDEDVVKAFASVDDINNVLKSIVKALPKNSAAVL